MPNWRCKRSIGESSSMPCLPQFAFLGGTVRLEGQASVKTKGQHREQPTVDAVTQSNQKTENQDVNRRLDKLTVVNRTNAWNHAQRERGPGPSQKRIDFFWRTAGLGAGPPQRPPGRTEIESNAARDPVANLTCCSGSRLPFVTAGWASITSPRHPPRSTAWSSSWPPSPTRS